MFMQKMKSKPLQNLEKRLQKVQSHQYEAEKYEQTPKQEALNLKQEKDRSKQDILELRKKMMKSTVREKKDNFAVEHCKIYTNVYTLAN